MLESATCHNLLSIKQSHDYNKSIANELNKICSPLEHHFGIKLISYRRFYLNGGLIHLTTNSEWCEHWYENRYWISDSFQERVNHLSQKNNLYYIWPNTPANDRVYSALYDLNIWNGVMIYKKYPDCIESYGFASAKRENSEVKNVYLYERDILEHFIQYFKEKIMLLVKPFEKSILLPYNIDLPKNHQNCKVNKRNFYNEIKIKNYYLRMFGEDIKITAREKECLALFSTGKKMKEIANSLKLSPRTIEFYLNNLMQKTNLSSKRQLIKLFHENEF